MARARSRFLILFILLSPAGTALAYEVDNFTGRDSLERDALPVLNAEVNRILGRAASEHNRESPRFCSKALLRQEILRWIRPDPVGILETWAANTKAIQRTAAARPESVYEGVTFFDAPILWTVGIGRSFLLAGHVVGTDKLGHFFMQGLDYYDLENGGKPIDRILKEDHKEDGVWGLSTSGVYSYADKAANYQGYRFWKSLVSGDRPYFRCQRKKGWVQARNFDWTEYVDDTWDEAVNCSEMRPSIARAFNRTLKERGISCPIAPEKCLNAAAVEKSEFFLSPSCKEVVRDARGHVRDSTHASR